MPASIQYSCGTAGAAVFNCSYTEVVGISDYRYTCVVDTVLDTLTTPSESWTFNKVCKGVSLVDPAVFNATLLLQPYGNADGCYAIHQTCGEQYGADICPTPFVMATGNEVCNAPQATEYLTAVVYSKTVHCWQVTQSPDSFQCLNAPDDNLLFLSCTLLVNWASFYNRPTALGAFIVNNC
jgi:hypothetical protein